MISKAYLGSVFPYEQCVVELELRLISFFLYRRSLCTLGFGLFHVEGDHHGIWDIKPCRLSQCRLFSFLFLNQKKWLNTKEAADYLGLTSRESLYQLVRRGLVPHCKLGGRYRFKRVELDEAIEQGRRLTVEDAQLLWD